MQETISEVDTPKRRSRRSYTKEFKARIVAQCGQGDKSIAQVAMAVSYTHLTLPTTPYV